MSSRRRWFGALCAGSVVAACSSAATEPVSTTSTQQDARAGEVSDDAIVAPTSSIPPATTTTDPPGPTTTVEGVFASDADRELSVGLLLSESGFGQRVSLPIGVGAGKADQDVGQVGLPFNPQDGDFSSLFIISGNGDLAEDATVLTDSFVELLEADIDILIGPTLGADLGELTSAAAGAGVPFVATGYVHDGSLATEGVRFDIAGSLDSHLDAIGREVVQGAFDSIVVAGSADDDLGNRVEALLERAGATASLALMPAAGDLDDVRRLASDVAERGERIAVVMATDTNAAEFIDAVIAEPNGRDAVFFGADFTLSQATVSSIRSLRDGQVVVVRRANDAARPEQVDFLARIQENNPELVRPFDAADSYDMYVLAALASVESSTASASSIRDRIVELSRDGEPCVDPASCFALLSAGVDIDYDGVSGPIEFDDEGVSTVTWFAIDTADPASGQLVTSRFVLHSR